MQVLAQFVLLSTSTFQLDNNTPKYCYNATMSHQAMMKQNSVITNSF